MRKTKQVPTKRKPLFTNRHYKYLAHIIHNLNLNPDQKFIVFLNFTEHLSKDNPHFNMRKFQTQIYSVVENPAQKGGETR